MSFFADGVAEAWRLITSGDPYLVHLVWVTLQVATIPTAAALVLGLPLGVGIGLARFRGAGLLRALANAGLGLPPVIVGLVLALLLLPVGPLGHLRLLFTLEGVFVAQTILAFPIIVALTASAVRDLPPGLLDQARALGARRPRVAVLALREARIGVIAATIAAVGSGLSEVGAVVLVGGNIQDQTQTLASAALTRVDAGNFAEGVAIGIILIGLILLVSGALTWLQYGGRRVRLDPHERVGRVS